MSRPRNLGIVMDAYQQMHEASGAGKPGVTPAPQTARLTFGGTKLDLAVTYDAAGTEDFTVNGQSMQNDARELIYLLITAGVEIFPTLERGRFLTARRKRIAAETAAGHPTAWADVPAEEIPTW